MKWSTTLKSYPGIVVMHVVFLFLSWYIHPLFSLVAFTPYFAVLNAPWKRFYYLKLFFLNICWNVTVTFWLCEIDWLKGTSAIIINSSLFLLPVIIWRQLIKFVYIQRLSTLLLLSLWLLFEYSHHLWDFSWPWLTIGNVFGKNPAYILWYRYTGIIGGSAWILLCNYALFQIRITHPFKANTLLKPALLLTTPLLLSFIILISLKQKKGYSHEQFLVVSTNVKNDSINDKTKLKQIETAFQKMPPKGKTTITILPETTLAENIWFGVGNQGNSLHTIKNKLTKWQTQNIITGALLKVADDKGNFLTKNIFTQKRYNEYNAALLLNHSDEINVKIKKVYIPIAEYIPPYLSSFFAENKSYSKESGNTDQFNINNNSYFICICYEAVNSLFVARHLGPNDKALIMLSSESFFGDSEIGREQYKNITRLRSIENGLPLIKSSNDGSTFICSETGTLFNYSRTNETSFFEAEIALSSPSPYSTVAFFLPFFFLSGIAFIIAMNLYPRLKGTRTLNPETKS